MTTRCEEIEESLVAWGDGELDEREAAEVAAHVCTCVPCGARAADFGALRQAIREALLQVPSPRAGISFAALEAEIDERGGTAAAAAQRPSRTARSGGQERPGRWAVRTPGAGARGGPGGSTDRARGARPHGKRLIVWGGALAAAGVALTIGLRGGPGTGPAGTTGVAPSVATLAAAPPGRDGAAPAASDRGRARDHGVTRSRGAAPGSGAEEGAVAPVGAGSVATSAEMAVPVADQRDLQVPEELRRRPGLFLDLPVVQRLEKLRRLEAINHHSDDGTSDGSAG